MEIGRATLAGPERRRLGRLGMVGWLLKRWLQRRSERATLLSLARMDPYLLRDMGIEPREIYDALDGRKSSRLFGPM